MATTRKGAGTGRAAGGTPAPEAGSASREGNHTDAAPVVAGGAWGQGLAAYPDWLQPYLPAMHDGFNGINKYFSVPALKAGLGKYISNPLTGYLMILRTRGRRSGEMRAAPLGYTIVGDAVYAMAGFGRQTHWLKNIQAEPRVEVILPGRSFSGIAEEVTDAAERLRVLPPLLRSMGGGAAAMGMGNVWQMTPEAISAKFDGLPLVRVRATGIAAGPEDPGGRFWVVPIVLAAFGLLWILRGRRRCCG